MGLFYTAMVWFLCLACSANALPSFSFFTWYWFLHSRSGKFLVYWRYEAGQSPEGIMQISPGVFLFFFFLVGRTIFGRQEMADGRHWFICHSDAVLPHKASKCLSRALGVGHADTFGRRNGIFSSWIASKPIVGGWRMLIGIRYFRVLVWSPGFCLSKYLRWSKP